MYTSEKREPREMSRTTHRTLHSSDSSISFKWARTYVQFCSTGVDSFFTRRQEWTHEEKGDNRNLIFHFLVALCWPFHYDAQFVLTTLEALTAFSCDCEVAGPYSTIKLRLCSSCFKSVSATAAATVAIATATILTSVANVQRYSFEQFIGYIPELLCYYRTHLCMEKMITQPSWKPELRKFTGGT